MFSHSTHRIGYLLGVILVATLTLPSSTVQGHTSSLFLWHPHDFAAALGPTAVGPTVERLADRASSRPDQGANAASDRMSGDAALVAYYSFDDGTARDTSGYGNHGNTQGSPGQVPGVSGSAFRFGGWYDQDRIVVPASNSLAFVDNFTFSLWFNILSNTSEDGWGRASEYGGQTFLAKSGDRSGWTMWASRSTTDGTWYPSVQNARFASGTFRSVKIQDGLGVGLNQWHMLSATHGNGIVRLYLDGILQEEMLASEFNLNTSMSSRPLYIGQELTGSSGGELWYPFNGILDEIRIYHRVLDSNEIRDLYQLAAPALSIMGRVKDGKGDPVAGVVITSSSEVSVTTNANGGYRINDLTPGVYTLIPQKAGHEFLPATHTVSVPPNGAWQDFIMGPSITGHVRDSGGNPLSDVQILAGPGGSATTDASGAYTITLPAGLSAGSYSLAANRPGTTFTGPLAISVPPDANGKDFVGTAGASDVTAPTGAIQSPANSETITNPGIYFTATATDDTGGSGVSRVEFYIQFDGKWRFLGQRTSAPFSLFWAPPASLATQPITFTIHIYDAAGNVALDPGGQRPAIFLKSTQENWISTRGYLNQLALGENGWEMCSMASIAMLQASSGRIGTDVQSLQVAANAAWSSGMRAPGLAQVAAYLESSNPGIEAWPFTCSSTDASRCWNLIQSEIDADRPVIFNSPPSGSLTSYGHYLVIVGYSGAVDPAQRQLIMYDPYGRWKGTQNAYDRNSTAVYTADGMKGRWRYYSFSSLAQKTLNVITIGPGVPTALGNAVPSRALQRSQPDSVVVLDTEDIVTYVGIKPMTKTFLPLVLLGQ